MDRPSWRDRIVTLAYLFVVLKSNGHLYTVSEVIIEINYFATIKPEFCLSVEPERKVNLVTPSPYNK